MRKLVSVFELFGKRSRQRIGCPSHLSLTTISTIFKMASHLWRRANEVRFLKLESKWVRIPKGKVAVYVGESHDGKQRVLVPVRHLNHPLFWKLLEEAEKVYGFNHMGAICIPCGIPEFEAIQNIIATTKHDKGNSNVNQYCN